MSLTNFDLLVDIGQKIPYTPQKRQVYGRINKKYYNGNNEKFLEQMILDSIEQKDFQFG